MNTNTITLDYTYEVGGGQYSISKTVSPAKDTESVYLKIEGWSNRRLLYIDRKNGISYLQASAEGTDCHRCGICQKRMKELGWMTGHTFVQIEGNHSLYVEMSGVPVDTTPETLSRFLGLSII